MPRTNRGDPSSTEISIASLCRRPGVEVVLAKRRRRDAAGAGERAELPPANTANTGKKAKKKPATGAASVAMAAPPRSRDETPPPNGPRTSLGAGIVAPCYARIDWAALVRRIYMEDVLACPCGGRRRVLAEMTDRDAIVAVLLHLGLDPDAPPIARARDPTDHTA